MPGLRRTCCLPPRTQPSDVGNCTVVVTNAGSPATITLLTAGFSAIHAVDANNVEDGSNRDPARSGSAVVSLAKYHPADTNHDGKLSLTELPRVIELYHHRSGTVRTGEYHAQAGIEDGFGVGP